MLFSFYYNSKTSYLCKSILILLSYTRTYGLIFTGALKKEHKTRNIIQFYGLSIFDISQWY